MDENITIDLLNTFADDPEVTAAFNAFVENISSLEDDIITENSLDLIAEGMREGLAENLVATSIESVKQEFKQLRLTSEQVAVVINGFKDHLKAYCDSIDLSEKKKALVERILPILFTPFEALVDNYNYDIELPILLEENAQVPTYAHATDAAADLYAAEDTVLPANSISNKVKTGVHIALPEGWTALIVPRSSIGMKTGLRLSNSVGVIDSEYRGPLGVIYDNISNSDYTIKQGDRIAQMFILPTYHFKAQVVDKLDDTSRGSGGFGSTGK